MFLCFKTKNTQISSKEKDKFYSNDGSFTIETNDEQSYQLQVYSLLGELVFDKTVTNKEQINLLHLSSSTYITKIVKDGAVIKTARICIIK